MRAPRFARMLFVCLLCTLAIGFAGCTVIERQEAQSQEQLLAAAGFNIVPADTPEKLKSLQAMKQRKLIRRTAKNGQLQFLFADAMVCRCLYVGNEAAYQQYQKLAVEQQIAIADREAALDAEMDAPLMYDWWTPGVPY